MQLQLVVTVYRQQLPVTSYQSAVSSYHLSIKSFFSDVALLTGACDITHLMAQNDFLFIKS